MRMCLRRREKDMTKTKETTHTDSSGKIFRESIAALIRMIGNLSKEQVGVIGVMFFSPLIAVFAALYFLPDILQLFNN